MSEDKFSKLPELAKPAIYDLFLKPCLKSFQFEGQSTIHLDITKKTDYLKLYCTEIDIKRAALELENGNVLNDLKLEFDKKWTLLTVKFSKELDPQKAKLTFDFVGQINDKMQGFSRSSYKDTSGNEKFLAYTQFESTYARSAFPCWDEPEYKAVFNVSMEVDDKYTALSNMNVIGEKKLDDGKKVVRFASTPLMSCYLVAFALGEFEYIQKNSGGGIDVRVYTVPGKKDQGAFALDLAGKCLDYYSEWFGIPCPLPKCDLIAIPDFCMGAMENWGLVTYREVCLLVDQLKSSTRGKQGVALTVAHELGHFWFGNLVTMKWWTDLWLKEGFASFMEYMAVDKLCPEFNIWRSFLDYEVASGFSLDSMRNSHPIEVEIINPNELDEIYDCISYSKSNCVIRMLCNYLSEPVFQKGLRTYLKKFQYCNAQTTDLWDALREASGQDVNALMSSWTKQMGYPLVSVEQEVEGKERVLKLQQARFIADGGADEMNSLWQVPIEIISATDPSKPVSKLLFTKKKDVFTVNDLKPTDWIKMNAGTSGFYRVHYSDEMLGALLRAVESKQMLVADRFGLAQDLFALVESGKIAVSSFLKFVAASSNEDEYIVWTAVDGGIASLKNVLLHHSDESLAQSFDAYIVKCLEPVVKSLGWEPHKNEDSQVCLLRALLLSRLAKSGHKPTIETSLKKFDDDADLIPDLRKVVFGCAGRSNDKERSAKLQKIFDTCGFSEVEESCLVAMAQTSDRELLETIYQWGIDRGKVRSQNIDSLFCGSLISKAGQEFVWDFFKKNMRSLLKKYGSPNSSLFQCVLKKSSSSQSSEAFVADFESFCKDSFDSHEIEVLDRPIKQIVESIRLNVKLLKENAVDMKSFLTTHGQMMK